MTLKNRLRMAGTAGFTLIEILVATSIASLILVIVYTSYQSIVKSIKRSTGHAEFYENVNLAISKIDMDLSNAYYTKNNKKTTLVCEDVSGNSRLIFISVNHNNFLSGNITKPNPVCDVKEVGYYLLPNKNIKGLHSLIKREKIHYGEEESAHYGGGYDNVMLVNVVSLKFEFQRGNDWDDAWDSRLTNLYPRAVRTTLVVKNYQEQDERFVFVSIINMRDFK